MATVIQRTSQLDKCLAKLRRAGGRGALAARHIEAIIATLAANASLRPAEVHKLTRRGEARIGHCNKFDLVGGYRLVYVKEQNHYIFLFAGTHDDCDRWLEHHKDCKPELKGGSTAGERDTPVAVAPPGEHVEPTDESDYDAMLMQRIDEKMLRRVFRGLYGA